MNAVWRKGSETGIQTLRNRSTAWQSGDTMPIGGAMLAYNGMFKDLIAEVHGVRLRRLRGLAVVLITLACGLSPCSAAAQTSMAGHSGWGNCDEGIYVAFDTDFQEIYLVGEENRNGPKVRTGHAVQLKETNILHFRGYRGGTFERWIAGTTLKNGCYLVRGMSMSTYGGTGYFELMVLPGFEQTTTVFKLGYSADHWIEADNRFRGGTTTVTGRRTDASSSGTTGTSTDTAYAGDTMEWIVDPSVGMGFQCGANAIINFVGPQAEYQVANVERVDGNNVLMSPGKRLQIGAYEPGVSDGKDFNWELPIALDDGCYQMVLNLQHRGTKHDSYAALYKWKAIQPLDEGSFTQSPDGWVPVWDVYLRSTLGDEQYLPRYLGGHVPVADSYRSTPEEEVPEIAPSADDPWARLAVDD